MADILIPTDGVRNISDFLRGSTGLAHAINYNSDTVGLLEGRPGYSEVGTAVAAYAINGLRPFSPAGAMSVLLAVTNGASTSQINKSTGGVWSNITSAPIKDAKYSMEEFLNLCFIAGASDTTFVTQAVIDSSYAYSTVNANLTGMPKSRFIRRYKDQLYCWNLENYESRLQWSSIPTANAITWPTENYALIPDDQGGDKGMGMDENSENLLLFKQRSIWTWNGDSVNQVSAIGTCASRSIASVNNVTFFLSRGGIYAYAGALPKRISKPIQKWINGIDQSQIQNAVGWTDEDHYYCYVGSCVVDGISYTNIALRFTISDSTWYVYKYGHTFTAAATWVDANGKERTYLGTSIGKVEKMAQDVDGIYTDDGSAIFSSFRTGRIYGKVPGFKQKIDEIKIFCDKIGNLKIKYRGDGGDWSYEDQIKLDVQTLSKNPPGAYYYEIEGTSSTETLTSQPTVMQGFSFIPNTIMTR